TPAICVPRSVRYSHVLFFNDASPPEPYTLSLHDALPISQAGRLGDQVGIAQICRGDLQRRDIEIRQSIDTWLVPGRAQVGDALRCAIIANLAVLVETQLDLVQQVLDVLHAEVLGTRAIGLAAVQRLAIA